MVCRFEHDGDCCNCGSPQYMARCRPLLCGCAVPITNADRIRAMSDEELEVFINKGSVCERCAFLGKCVNPYSPEQCHDGVLQWLRQPVQPTPDAPDTHEHSGLLEE